MNLLAAAFSSGLAAYLTYVKSTTAANTGFSLNMAGMSSALRALGVNETSLRLQQCRSSNLICASPRVTQVVYARLPSVSPAIIDGSGLVVLVLCKSGYWYRLKVSGVVLTSVTHTCGLILGA